MTTSELNEEPSKELDQMVQRPSKTPLFQTINAPRYQRQALLKEIQNETGNKLICYVAGRNAPVDREDVVCFVDLLYNIPNNENIDLLLHSGGGDIDAADKLITMIRKKVGTAKLRVIVPDYAKSAATLIALGADSIVMSDTSELGPIDPQVIRTDRNGNRMQHSVKNYIDAYSEHESVLRKKPDDIVAQVMLSKLDPETVKLFKQILDRAREFAERQLKRGMMKDQGNWSQAVTDLLDGGRFFTHGQPIMWEDASDAKLGLNVEYLASQDPIWSQYWLLYCQQMLSVKPSEKLFESDIASVCIETSAV